MSFYSASFLDKFRQPSSSSSAPPQWKERGDTNKKREMETDGDRQRQQHQQRQQQEEKNGTKGDDSSSGGSGGGDVHRCPSKARIAKPHLMRRHLEVGKTYRWCSCGYASDDSQPWCDDTCHRDSNIQGWEPVEFSVDKQQTWWPICGCKQSKSQWRCDGTHSFLEW